MTATAGLLVHQVMLEIRHPAWAPRNPDGSSPIVAGTGVAGLNDWQPLAFGSVSKVVGASPNTVTYRPDNGLKVMLTPFGTSDMIEAHTGDGDTVDQNVSHEFETLKNRTLSFDWTRKGRWIEALIWRVFDDRSPKRPLEIRETWVDEPAAVAAVNKVGGYAAAFAGVILADGAGLADMAVEDLVTLDASVTIYKTVAVTADSLTVDRPLVAALDDNDVVARAAILKRITAEYLVSDPGPSRGTKATVGQTAELVPTGVFSREGMGA